MLLKLLNLPSSATEEELVKAHAAAMRRAAAVESPDQAAQAENSAHSFADRSAAFNARLDEFMRPVASGGKGFKSIDAAISAMRQDADCAALLHSMGK